MVDCPGIVIDGLEVSESRGEDLTVFRNIVRHNSGYELHLYPSIRGAKLSQNLVFGHVYQSGIGLTSLGRQVKVTPMPLG